MIKAVLIDDEPEARADLRALLQPHAAGVQVVAEAETLDAAEALLARDDYDLVFLDVQLRGGTGFDLVPRVRPEARVVFVTAHDAYALRAFEVNALDYLLKPIAPERLAASLERVAAHFAHSASPDKGIAGAEGELAAGPLRPGDTVFLRSGGHGRFVRLSGISAIEADENYSVACLADGARLMLRRTLKSWEDVLPESLFMRVHRTAIVNLGCVVRFERDREERTLLFLEGMAEPVNASRKLWPELQGRLEQRRRAM